MFKYKHPRPALTVDVVVFGVALSDPEPSLDVLLIRRRDEPFKGGLALLGGFVKPGEALDAAAFRELKEETGMVPTYLEQLYTFGEPERDPRERVVSVAYMALVPSRAHVIQAGDDAAEVGWYDVRSFDPAVMAFVGAKVKVSDKKKRTKIGPATINARSYEIRLGKAPEKLAFDHDQILNAALVRLSSKVRYAPIGFDLMPPVFTMGQLQRLYEIVHRQPLDKSNFRKKVESLDILADAGKTSGPGRVASLYRFDKDKYECAVQSGINFEI
jgi:8-oxo-dGTP diphosphatase